MSLYSEMFKQAQLALAAYANLSRSGSNADALIGAGLSPTQVIKFEQLWRVVDQYPGPSGLSATVFEEVSTGTRYLAIRGTEASDLNDVWTDIVDIALFGTSERQAQYAALKSKVTQWQANGTLPSTFTVAGHSLGGFLAGALLVDFSNQIEHAYLYNAPGVGGLSAALRLLLGIDSLPSLDLAKVFNVRGDAGLSPIAGLGVAWGIPIPIVIENQLAPDVQSAPAALNHSQQVLTDALAIIDLYSRIDGNLGVNQINAIVSAATNRAAQTLEISLDVLRRLFWQSGAASVAPTPIGNRDALYLNLYEPGFQQRIAAYGGQLQVALLAEYIPADLASIAQGSEALAYRYALTALNSFAVLGNNDLYAAHNTNGELNLYNQDDGTGTLTARWITDRAQFLSAKISINTNDQQVGINSTSTANYWYQDVALGEKAYILSSGVPRNTGKLKNAQSIEAVLNKVDAQRVFFGSDNGDSLTGWHKDDSLYGNGGADRFERSRGKRLPARRRGPGQAVRRGRQRHTGGGQ